MMDNQIVNGNDGEDDLVTGRGLTDRGLEDLLRRSADAESFPRTDDATVEACVDDIFGRLEARRAKRLAASSRRRVLVAVRHLLRRLTDEARNHAIQRLTEIVAELGERFHGSFTWLFVKEGNVLKARVTHNTRMRDLELPLRGHGIVPHVARVGQGYYSNDVSKDLLYRNDLAETRSEMAVPLVTGDGRMLGVLNVDSRMPGAFSAGQVEDLQAAAGDLVPHLLILEALKGGESWCPWHPEVHGWDLRDTFRQICHAVKDGLGGDGMQCTIWYADWANDELFVYATSGYGYEYVTAATLPIDSFTGRVAASPEGTVREGRPGDRGFVPKENDAIMGLRKIMAAPIYPGSGPDEPPDRGRAVLSIYCFDDQAEEALPSREVMARLVEWIGRMTLAYRDLRREVGVACLHQALYAQPCSSDFDFETIKEKFVEILQVDAMSIFARHRGSDQLYCVATTGLETVGRPRRYPPPPEHGESVCYDLRVDRGYTTYLAEHPGLCVRSNAGGRGSSGPRTLPDFPPSPRNKHKHREKLPRTDTDHRRFLGLNVDVDGDTLAVFRLIRSARTKPFTRCDEELVARLARVCVDRLMNWRAMRPEGAPEDASPGHQDPVLVPQPGRDGRALVGALARFMRPVPSPRSARALTDELLQDICVIFRDCHIIQSAVVLKHKHAERIPFRLYAYHSQRHRTPPSDEDLAPMVVRVPEAGWESLLRGRKAVTFQRNAARGVAAGIRIPLIAWAGLHLVEGILSLDFGERFDRWSSDAVELLFRATRKLSAILGHTRHVIRPEWFQADCATALERFISFPRSHLGAEWTELLLNYGDRDHFQPVARWPRCYDVPEVAWSRVDATVDEDAAALGVAERRGVGKPACSIPLYLGPFHAATLRCGMADVEFPDRRRQFIGEVTGLWSALTFGMESFSKVAFHPSPLGPGATSWDEQISWPELGRPAPRDPSSAGELPASLIFEPLS
jgi:putative methionine-R-sulfoxide reductase with GAF domain